MFAIFLFVACQSSDIDSAKSTELTSPQASQTAVRKVPMEFIFDTNTLESAHLDCESGQIEGELEPLTQTICSFDGNCIQGEGSVLVRFEDYPKELCSISIEALDI